MTGPLGTADFFALEAGECLDRLETLAARPDGVPADEFLRVARALRGSALMANRQPIARTAAALELLARAVRDQRRPWDAAAREQSLNAVEDLRLLVRRGSDWSDADTAHAARLAQALESLAGRRVQEGPARTPPAAPNGEITPGVRAFVARECTLVAGALDRAARTARSDPSHREPLYEVLRRMQSLRGLAELSELSPLPELLDGLELALGDLTRLFAPPPEAPSVLEAGARALARVSREVAEQGRPTPDADEAREFTDLLLRAFAAESDVVPIEALFAAGDAEPIRHGALNPAFEAPGPLGAIELLSHGEHLYQIADQIERARSRTERDLKLYALVSPLRSLATGGDSPVQPGLRAFADAARSHIAGGIATERPGVFADVLREAGALLRSAGGRGEPGDPVARLQSLAERLTADAALTPAVAAIEPPGAAPADTVDAVGRDPQPETVVPIQALAYTGEQMIVEWGTAGGDGTAGTAGTDDIVAIELLAPVGHEVPGPLEASWASYERLVEIEPAEHPEAPPSVEPPGRRAAEPPPSPDLDVVAISELLYRGRDALLRADAVRLELANALSSGTPLAELRPLVDELVDLVPLALE